MKKSKIRSKFTNQWSLTPLILISLAFLLAIGATLFFTANKLDEHGICWAKARALTDEELYQNAMKDYIKQAFEFRALRMRVTGECREDWACQIWIGMSLDKKQLAQKIEKSINLDKAVFVTYFQLSLLEGSEQLFNRFNPTISSNNFIITWTDNGQVTLLASDCCRVRTYLELSKAKNLNNTELFAVGAINKEDKRSNQKFLQIDKYDAADIYTDYYSSQQRKIEAMTNSNRFHAGFLPLTACGDLTYKPFNYATDMPNPSDWR